MKKLSKKKRIALIAAAAVVVLFAGCYAFYLNELSAVNNKKQDVVFVVEEGETMDSVLERLQQEGLIKSSTFASLHARISNQTQNIAGIFVLNDQMSTDEILRVLNDPTQVRTDQLLITFPEGRWAKDYAAQIEEQLGINADEILALWNDPSYIETLAKDYSFLDADALNNEEYRVRLEGYLFPETYAFDKDATADEVTRTFLDHFAEIYAKYEEDINASDYSLHELITLASIVQYEAATSEDLIATMRTAGAPVRPAQTSILHTIHICTAVCRSVRSSIREKRRSMLSCIRRKVITIILSLTSTVSAEKRGRCITVRPTSSTSSCRRSSNSCSKRQIVV